MTKTTDSRQVRLMFQEILARHGIENPQLEADCCNAAKNYFEFRLKSSDPVRAKDNAVQRQGEIKFRVADTWKLIMLMDYVPWEGTNSTKGKINKRSEWQGFLGWLAEKDAQGYSVSRFCTWFMSDSFRAKTVAMWTPNGRKTDGAYSFKAIYMQAFQDDDNKAGYNPQGLEIGI